LLSSLSNYFLSFSIQNGSEESIFTCPTRNAHGLSSSHEISHPTFKNYTHYLNIQILPQPSKRIRALVAPKSTFQRFVDYTTEEDRIAAQREKEIAKITELKKATHEKTKTWNDTMKVRYKVTSITRRRKINRYFRCAL